MPKQEGGLGEVGGNLGVPKSQQEKIHSEWDTYESVVAELASKGFTFPGQPGDEIPVITAKDLLTEDSTEFSQIIARNLGWLNYTKDAHGHVRAKLLQLKEEMADIAKEVRRECRKFNSTMTSKDTKFTVADMEDEVSINPTYHRLKLQALPLEQHRILLDVLMENLDRNYKVLSRQVEINRQELDAEVIKNNLPQRLPPSMNYRK